MSRIGKKPVEIPQGVKIDLKENLVTVEGPKGRLSYQLPENIDMEVQDNQILVRRMREEKNVRALHGLARAIIANMITGVTKGFQKELEIVGVGYRAQMKGKTLVLQIGFSHPLEYHLPEGITAEVPKPTNVVIRGIDKQKVGEVAAEIRAFFPPEPYKGKGIRYKGEYVRKKAGKAGVK